MGFVEKEEEEEEFLDSKSFEDEDFPFARDDLVSLPLEEEEEDWLSFAEAGGGGGVGGRGGDMLLLDLDAASGRDRDRSLVSSLEPPTPAAELDDIAGSRSKDFDSKFWILKERLNRFFDLLALLARCCCRCC